MHATDAAPAMAPRGHLSMPADRHIPGLDIIPGWVTELAVRRVVDLLGDAGPARDGTQRNRIERYGRGVVASGYVDPVTASGSLHDEIPFELEAIALRLVAQGFMRRPDAVTVNWLLPGQGVDSHCDRDEAGGVIAVASISGTAWMRMERWAPVHDRVDAFLAPRTLVVMRDEARWRWNHQIMPVTEPRMSVVFRRALP